MATDNVHLFWTSADNGKVMAYKPGDDTLKEVVGPHGQQTLKLARLVSINSSCEDRAKASTDLTDLFAI